ncbi:hypothetical protein FOPE_00745 [Fonsecaea pedrosoi]|nr:hypothetical protein FOPE_00745 [Fonsecaea pedrosoi]
MPRRRKENQPVEVEAAATFEGWDDMDEASKRRIRNRLSQRHFRERKSLYIKSLEKASKASTQTESARNKALSKELADLRTATLKMRAQILKLSCSLHAVGTEVGKILHVKGLEDSDSTPGLQDTNPMSSPLSNLAYEEESSSPGGLNPGNLSDEYAEYPELTELNLQPHHTEHDNERLSRSEASQRTDTGHETRPPDETSNDNVPVLNPSPSSADDLQPETGTHQGEQHPSHHFVNHNGSLPNATVQAASPEWGVGDPNSLEFYSQPMGPMGFQVYGTTFASPRAATRMTSPAAVGASATASFDTAQQVAGQTLHTHTAAPGHPDLTVHQRASLQQAGQHQEHQHQQHGPDPLLQSVPGQTNLSLPAGHFPPWFGGDLSPNNPSSAFARHMETLELQVRCRIDAAPDGSSREKLIRSCSTIMSLFVQNAWPSSYSVWFKSQVPQIIGPILLWRICPSYDTYNLLGANYKPTELQLSVPHSAVIDWVPYSELRDKIIMYYNQSVVLDRLLCDMMNSYVIEVPDLAQILPQAPRGRAYFGIWNIFRAIDVAFENQNNNSRRSKSGRSPSSAPATADYANQSADEGMLNVEDPCGIYAEFALSEHAGSPPAGGVSGKEDDYDHAAASSSSTSASHSGGGKPFNLVDIFTTPASVLKLSHDIRLYASRSWRFDRTLFDKYPELKFDGYENVVAQGRSCRIPTAPPDGPIEMTEQTMQIYQ